jgi:hypothetical protein
MKKFKFLPPYRKEGKTTFPATRNRAGVYLIKEGERLVYIGMSGGNLYRTLYRHFEAWSHPSQEVTTYQSRMKKHRYTVRVVLCTPGQAVRLERALIVKHRPRDNDRGKNYTLDFKDEKIEHEYSQALTAAEMPF